MEILDTFSVTVTVKSNGLAINNARFSGVATGSTITGDGDYTVNFSSEGIVQVEAPGFDKGSFRIDPFVEKYTVILKSSGSDNMSGIDPSKQ
jgi:hypothetical protein